MLKIAEETSLRVRSVAVTANLAVPLKPLSVDAVICKSNGLVSKEPLFSSVTLSHWTFTVPASKLPSPSGSEAKREAIVDPNDLKGRPKKADPNPESPYGIKHPLHPANLKKKKIKNA